MGGESPTYTKAEIDSKITSNIYNSNDAYDPTKAYALGDLVIYNNTLYRCTTACSAGSWTTNQSCFTQDTLVNVANNTKVKITPRTITTDANGLYSINISNCIFIMPTSGLYVLIVQQNTSQDLFNVLVRDLSGNTLINTSIDVLFITIGNL